MYPLLDAILLWFVRALAGPTAAQRLGAATESLYPAAGRTTARYRRSRMLLRSLFHLGPTVQWLDFLWSSKLLLTVLRQHPYLAEKIHRPYCCKSLGAGARAGRLVAHYHFALRHSGTSLLLAAMQTDATLAELTGRSGRRYKLLLGSAQGLPKEGELVLRLDCDGFTLQKAAFVCGDQNGVPSLIIGCWQGNKCPTSRDRMREATRDLSGLRPRDLLLLGMQAMASAFALRSIAGVGDGQHIYRHWRKRRTIIQSYDALWTDVGGVREQDGMFSLPLDLRRRPLHDYPSNKRSAAARRHALEDQARAQLAAAFAASQPDQQHAREVPAVPEKSMPRSRWRTVPHW